MPHKGEESSETVTALWQLEPDERAKEREVQQRLKELELAKTVCLLPLVQMRQGVESQF